MFRKQWQPQVNVDQAPKSEKIDDAGNFEVVLTITITAKIEAETAFLIEVQQAYSLLPVCGRGTCGASWAPPRPTSCSYARECIDTLAVKGGFPLMLAPINFDAM